MNTNIKLKIILGSTREKRFGHHAANLALEHAKKLEGVEAELLDLRDFALPFYNLPVGASQLKPELYTNPVAKAWRDKIDEADAFVFATPEYNHGVSAVLKNAIDWVYKEWNRKPVAMISWGTVGGARSVEHLRQIAVELQMTPTRFAVHIPEPWELVEGYDNDKLPPGALDSFAAPTDKMLEDLMWWARTLKAGRESK